MEKNINQKKEENLRILKKKNSLKKTTHTKFKMKQKKKKTESKTKIKFKKFLKPKFIQNRQTNKKNLHPQHTHKPSKLK